MSHQNFPPTATIMLTPATGEALEVCVALSRRTLASVESKVAAGEADLEDRCAVRMMSQEGLERVGARLAEWAEGDSILLELSETEIRHLACCVNHFKGLVEEADERQYEDAESQAQALDMLILTLGQLDLALRLVTGEGYEAWTHAVAASLEGQVVS